MNKMTTSILAVLVMATAIIGPANAAEKPNKTKKVKIVSFGAHPDDAEIRSGGTAMLWNQVGSKTLMVSLTNGDVGHFVTSGEALAKRRLKEVQKASEILGTTAKVLDIHDGELMPTLENRKAMVRIIREWKADLVIGHRPCDYHPDHRYAGTLMQDTAYMAAVPSDCSQLGGPDTPRSTNCDSITTSASIRFSMTESIGTRMSGRNGRGSVKLS